MQLSEGGICTADSAGEGRRSPPGSRLGTGCDGGNSGEKRGACSGPDKVEHQQTHPECVLHVGQTCRGGFGGLSPRIIAMLYRGERDKAEAQPASNGQVLMIHGKKREKE